MLHRRLPSFLCLPPFLLAEAPQCRGGPQPEPGPNTPAHQQPALPFSSPILLHLQQRLSSLFPPTGWICATCICSSIAHTLCQLIKSGKHRILHWCAQAHMLTHNQVINICGNISNGGLKQIKSCPKDWNRSKREQLNPKNDNMRLKETISPPEGLFGAWAACSSHHPLPPWGKIQWKFSVLKQWIVFYLGVSPPNSSNFT